MKQDSEYLKEIKDALWNICEDSACDILNAYYRQCKKDGEECIDNEGNSIYNLMDSRQAIDAVKGYGFTEVCDTFSKKPDWILVVNWNLETKKPILSTEGPSVVLEKCLRNIVCSFIYDPMAYPAFFREAVSMPLSKLISLYI